MYASDITRTFPASGTFTAPQRDLYEAVLNVQKVLVERSTVDSNLQDLQRSGGCVLCILLMVACRLLEEELRQIGFKLSSGDVQRKLVSGSTRCELISVSTLYIPSSRFGPTRLSHSWS